ncbi:hypothetical protein AMATHDRAFT_73726 [Amanita thiersii Skay4041]|uniref:Needs CLA4 to survive protein 3 n=1 Tax=Amanita thiersii Skay4041 TaxID=703135 RepID=A0A2A9NSX8_9AGAR|nr:hypothetical protein AMATHDRAFT_73726 [Amanita thiersii Skay4041]
MLSLQEYLLYGRQMVLDGFGLSGQLKLQGASIAVVGAGGLGCPALQYLAAAGVGRLAIIDHDIVELSNLQRQILHNEDRLGWNKAKSAARALSLQYPRLRLEVHDATATKYNVLSLLQPHDIVLDCTDNMQTRYLLSDTCVALQKPLVSGAAQKYDGQLCTYNLGRTGPCYRCLFPKPPAPSVIGSCEEVGILGAVTGLIGTLQALEAIKITIGLHDLVPSLLIFSSMGLPPFRSIKLRSRSPSCVACGQTKSSSLIHDTDYVQFCGEKIDWEGHGLCVSEPQYRISAQELKMVLDSSKPYLLIDVRSETEYEICKIPTSVNVPLNILIANPQEHLPGNSDTKIFIVCRLGNDSQIAAHALREVNERNTVRDMVGGLKAWSKDVDSTFPIY